MKTKDLCAAARVLRDNDFDGEDLWRCTVPSLHKELRVTQSSARKVVQARGEYLAGSGGPPVRSA